MMVSPLSSPVSSVRNYSLFRKPVKRQRTNKRSLIASPSSSSSSYFLNTPPPAPRFTKSGKEFVPISKLRQLFQTSHKLSKAISAKDYLREHGCFANGTDPNGTTVVFQFGARISLYDEDTGEFIGTWGVTDGINSDGKNNIFKLQTMF